MSIHRKIRELVELLKKEKRLKPDTSGEIRIPLYKGHPSRKIRATDTITVD
ncbi:MAG: hypothetical protein ACE5KK_03315 [Candidatus Brocadiales bacterium]